MLHEQNIKDYIEEYEQLNGQKPSKKEIDEVINIMISNGYIRKEVDEFISDSVSEFEKYINRKNSFSTSVSVIGGLMILNLGINFILLYFKEIGINLTGNYNILSLPNFVNAFLVVIITIIVFVLNNIKK